jgi:hypothetical protein
MEAFTFFVYFTMLLPSWIQDFKVDFMDTFPQKKYFQHAYFIMLMTFGVII